MSHGGDLQPGLQSPHIVKVRIGASPLHDPGHLRFKIPQEPHRRGLTKRHQTLAGGDGTEESLMEESSSGLWSAYAEHGTCYAEGNAKVGIAGKVETRIGFERSR